MSKYQTAYGQGDKVLSHGLTAQELDAIHDAQKRGQSVRTVKGNMNAEYELKEYEDQLIHFKMTIPQFDPVTGENQSDVRVCRWTPLHYAQQEKRGWFGGYQIEILHDPRKDEKSKMRTGEGQFISKSKPISVRKEKPSGSSGGKGIFG